MIAFIFIYLFTIYKPKINFSTYFASHLIYGSFLRKTTWSQIWYLLNGVEPAYFVPNGRMGHSSVIVGKRMYVFGGDKGSRSYTNEVFYLDLSQPFDIVNPPWTLLSSTIPVNSAWGTVALDNTNNASIYLFGGMMFNVANAQPQLDSFVYKFDVNSLIWNVPSIKGNHPENRMEMVAVNDNSRNVYIFGGGTNQVLGSQTERTFSEMVILNYVDTTWTTNAANNGVGRAKYAATLLSNGIIVYIGGIEVDNTNNMVTTAEIKKIILYDTKTSLWSSKIAEFTGSTPIQNRVRHTSVLAPNGQVVVYGGTQTLPGYEFAQASPDLFILDTETDQYKLTIPTISTNIGRAPSLAAHTANVFGNYMIIAFGNVTVQNDNPSGVLNNNLYVMDVTNYTWVDSFVLTSQSSNPPTETSTTPVPSDSNSNNSKSASNNAMIIVKIVCGIFGGVIVAVCVFLVYRWNKRRRENKRDSRVGIPGTVADDNKIGGFFSYWKRKEDDSVGFPGTAVDPSYIRPYQTNIA